MSKRQGLLTGPYTQATSAAASPAVVSGSSFDLLRSSQFDKGKSAIPNGSPTRPGGRVGSDVLTEINPASDAMSRARENEVGEGGLDMDAERLLRAQTYMEDAMAGKQSLLQTDIKTVVSYRFYHSWYMYSALSSIVVAHLCLIFFEKPNGDLNTQLPVGAACAIEILCLAFYVFRIVHYRNLMSSRKFWGDRKNVVLVAVLAICAVDTLQFLVVEGMNMNGVRFSRILRPLIYINFADFRQVRRGIRSMRKTIVAVGNVIVLLLLTIALFMLLFVKLFQFREWVDKSGKPYFASYSDAYFDLYVLMTSANFPDIMMPAIDHNYVYAFAFIIYFILATYIFLAIILASVYNNYRKHLKDEIEELIKTRRDNMRQAFHALKHTGSNAITFQDWKLLVNRIRPNYSKARVLLLWRVLDDNDNGNVTEREFLKAADVLNVNLQMSTSGKNVWTKHCPKLYATTGSMMIRKLVQSHYLSYFVNVAIIINVIVIATDDVDGQTTKKADYVFLTVFIVEILLKNWTYGIRNYFRSGWNQFDFTIVALYLFVLFVEGVTNLSESASNAMLELLMIFRVLRLVKIIGLTDRFRVIVDTIWHVRTAISMYGKILLVVYYVFAIIGMYCFAGKIYEGNRTLEGSTFEEGSPFYIDLHAGNPELEGSEFAADGYYANNFNDPISAFVTLFELQVVNQWHVQTEGFVLLTHKSARIYFVIFNLITVVLIMNIFISFVIEAFVLQLQFEASPTESTVERKIDAEIEKSPSLKAEFDRLTVAKKTAKTEEFLVRMFEAEILPTLNAIAGDDPFRPPSRVTSNGSDTLEEPNRLPGITSDTMRERHATQWGGGPEPTESATPSNGSIELPILGRNAEPAGDGSAA